MSVRREIRRERRTRVGLGGKPLRSPDWPQLGMRFALGAAIALAAGLAGMRFGPKVGGVFLAFPAILPAALTLLERSDGVEKTDVDAIGAVLGSIAMVAFAIVAAVLAARISPALAVIAGGAVWLVVALLLYRIGSKLLRV